MPIMTMEFRKRGKYCTRIIVMAHKSKPNKTQPKRKPVIFFSLTRISLVASSAVSALIYLNPKTPKKGMSPCYMPGTATGTLFELGW